MSRYTQRKDGEGWTVEPGQVFKLACCDCGLVHQVVIVIEDGQVGIAAKRDNRATGQRRRHNALAGMADIKDKLLDLRQVLNRRPGSLLEKRITDEAILMTTAQPS